jgi:endonuclease YncB( thermonuclease family)
VLFVIQRIDKKNQSNTDQNVDSTPYSQEKNNAPPRSHPAMNRESQDWTLYQNVTLAPHHQNDGDSFRVVLAEDSEQEFRLYFVDTPESQFKRYQDGNTNGERLEQQAKYFGGIEIEECIEVGVQAKKLMNELLSEQSFDVYTRFEEVYDSGRFFCHVRLTWKGKQRWLDEILVENGLARIITQPAELPDGTSAEKHKQHLLRLEAKAKKARIGGWK